MLDVFITVEDGVSLFTLDFKRNDFILELAVFLRGLGLVLRLQCKLILLLARDTEFLCDVFRSRTHVVLIVDIPQTVMDHGVDQLRVAHAETVTRIIQDMR